MSTKAVAPVAFHGSLPEIDRRVVKPTRNEVDEWRRGSRTVGPAIYDRRDHAILIFSFRYTALEPDPRFWGQTT